MRGRGCHVWDLDGREFIEYGMGLRSVTLGHGYPAVVEAATAAMQHGSNFTRPSPLEVECAERLLGLIDGADMVKFCKNGSDATTAAVKLARAYTGRDLVAICRDQPFFSIDDWFIGSTAMPAGIPKSARALTSPSDTTTRERRDAVSPLPRPDRLPDPGAGGRPGARPRVPRGPPALVRCGGNGPDLRRDDHGLPLAPRRRAEALRRGS